MLDEADADELDVLELVDDADALVPPAPLELEPALDEVAALDVLDVVRTASSPQPTPAVATIVAITTAFEIFMNRAPWRPSRP